MKKMKFILAANVIIITFIFVIVGGFTSKKVASNNLIRFALFNIWEMSTEKLTEVNASGVGQNDQLKAAAEIIRKINPDVLVINEIDHDIDALLIGKALSLNVHRFNDSYLNQGKNPLHYPFIYAAPCNTGFLAGKDLDNNGMVATEADRGSRDHGGDCYGYGVYPGQYSMAILSRYPLQKENARTFQKFLWNDLPKNLIPTEWYSPDEIEIFRLSSKSHWDIPVKIGEKNVHLLVSHPTPPVFDGDEDRNGRRNYDEIRMWVYYINNDSVMIDDSGTKGGLPENESFIIVGDLNAAPQGDKLETGQRAIDQLLNHERINDCGKFLVSKGALYGQEAGPPKYIERRTAGWNGRGLRIDHLLPSKDLKVVNGGVYWPDSTLDADGAAIAKKASDHRLIWLDFELK
ncbi:MAG: endonuclease/exonuclease/phosphatase family protein [Melioribacteraceae bacterium]|nr:endonuclease/exonuclease/phosphatase family protein [Melioribacteraceae bacterium]